MWKKIFTTQFTLIFAIMQSLAFHPMAFAACAPGRTCAEDTKTDAKPDPKTNPKTEEDICKAGEKVEEEAWYKDWQKAVPNHLEKGPAYTKVKARSNDAKDKPTVDQLIAMVKEGYKAQDDYAKLYEDNRKKTCKMINEINDAGAAHMKNVQEVVALDREGEAAGCKSFETLRDKVGKAKEYFDSRVTLFRGFHQKTKDSYSEQAKANGRATFPEKYVTAKTLSPEITAATRELATELQKEVKAAWGPFLLQRKGDSPPIKAEDLPQKEARTTPLGSRVHRIHQALAKHVAAQIEFNKNLVAAVRSLEFCAGKYPDLVNKGTIPEDWKKVPVEAAAADVVQDPTLERDVNGEQRTPPAKEDKTNPAKPDPQTPAPGPVDNGGNQYNGQGAVPATPAPQTKSDDSTFGIGGGTGSLLLVGVGAGLLGWYIGKKSGDKDSEPHYYPVRQATNPNPYPYPYPGPSPLPGPTGGPGGGGLPAGSYLGLSPMAPASAKSGTPISALTINVQTPSGAIYTGSDITINVTCSVANCLAGASTTSAKINNGTVTFSNLIFTGTFTNVTLTFSAVNLPPVTSTPFNVQ